MISSVSWKNESQRRSIVCTYVGVGEGEKGKIRKGKRGWGSSVGQDRAQGESRRHS